MAAVSVRVGDLLDGKYRLLRVLGEGGWGIVFEAENTRTLKHVAVKVLRPQSNLTPDIIARFEREAQAAGRIGSEHIVEVFDLGILEGAAGATHYMVLELLQGEDLASRIRSQRQLEPVATVKLIIQLLGGLAAAHNAGILHRDLKPENLFLVPTRSGEEFVKILDFGISKFSSETVASATVTGAVMGSPCYMAPEQARGLKQIDARTDLYAVGTVLFEAVTGRVPFMGDNFNDLMFKIVLEPRPRAIDFNPSLDPVLSEIIGKAIAIDPAERFATASEFRLTLVDWLDSQGVLSVHQPELRRAPRESLPAIHGTTPMESQRSVTPPLSTRQVSVTLKEDAHWSDATMPPSAGFVRAEVDAEGPTVAVAISVATGAGITAVAGAPRAPSITGSGSVSTASSGGSGAAASSSSGSITGSGSGPGSTPLASSRTVPKPPGRSKLLFAALGVGAVVGGWAVLRAGEVAPPAQGLVMPATTTAAATTAGLAQSAEAAQPALAPTTAATEVPDTTAAPSASASAPPAQASDSASTGHHHHTGKPAPGASAAVAEAKPAVSAASAASATPPPPKPPGPLGDTPKPPGPLGDTPKPPGPLGDTPKPPGPSGDTPKPPEPDKVEGRDIRSGL